MNAIKPRGKSQDCGCADGGACGDLPELVRMNYFHGQLLGPADFLTEQRYFREKIRLMNRCLHGYGVICGLEVSVSESEECPPSEANEERDRIKAEIAEINAKIEELEKALADAENDEAQEKIRRQIARLEVQREELERRLGDERYCEPGKDDDPDKGVPIRVSCGVGIDCCGNEIVVRHEIVADVTALLKASEREALQGQGGTVWLSICRKDCGFRPTRPLARDDCDLGTGCVNARIREGVCLRATTEEPTADDRCEFCCTPCEDPCLVLARIDVEAGRPIRPDDVDNSVRRPFGHYQPTTITGVGWQHGAMYSPAAAEKLVNEKSPTGGLRINFSRPVLVETLIEGTVELLRYHGGAGVAALITHVAGEFVGLPAGGTVDHVVYRNTTKERPQPGDRLMLVVRGSHILDACCQPVAAAHLGGRIPAIDENGELLPPERPDGACVHPPLSYGLWTSGAGVSFESWIHVAES